MRDANDTERGPGATGRDGKRIAATQRATQLLPYANGPSFWHVSSTLWSVARAQRVQSGFPGTVRQRLYRGPADADGRSASSTAGERLLPGRHRSDLSASAQLQRAGIPTTGIAARLNAGRQLS